MTTSNDEPTAEQVTPPDAGAHAAGPPKPPTPAVTEGKHLKAQEPFTLEKSKERATEAVERIKQASKEFATRPFLDAIGNYVYRGIDALAGLADGIEGKNNKKRDAD